MLERMGHSRQPSDSSVDKFVSKDEVAEAGDPESKVSFIGRGSLCVRGWSSLALPLSLVPSPALGLPFPLDTLDTPRPPSFLASPGIPRSQQLH